MRWLAISESERVKSTRVYGANCHRHPGNTWLDGGTNAEGKWLGALLADDIAEPQARRLRRTADINKLIHTLSKGLGESEAFYGKGVGVKKRAYFNAEHAATMYLNMMRAEVGSRQDLGTECAFVAYLDRIFNTAILGSALYASPNVLNDNLYCQLTSLPVRTGRSALDLQILL